MTNEELVENLLELQILEIEEALLQSGGRRHLEYKRRLEKAKADLIKRLDNGG